MRWLPAIAIGRAALRLPLCDGSAATLADLLLEGSAARRAARLESLLASDPALTVWTLGILARDERRAVRDLAGVAGLASRRLLRSLAALANSNDDSLDGATCEKAASIAGRLLSAPDDARFAIFAQSAADWAALPQTKPPSPRQIRDWLPETCRLPPRGEPSPAASEAAGCAPFTWSASDPAGAARLLALLPRLLRLTRLRRRFDAALEEEKLASLRELAYGASHEINNPLANISARAQTLLREEVDPERRRKLAAIKTQAQRAHEMIADLMLFARPPRLAPEPVDLAGLLLAIAAELGPEAQAQETQIVCHASLGSPILADPVQLAVALRAMIQNALEALGRGGTVSLELRTLGEAERAMAEITIADTGPGIRPEVRRHLFDPFYSGREAGRGLGFGLSKAWRIVTGHGGRIEVESPATGGARFRLLLPGTGP